MDRKLACQEQLLPGRDLVEKFAFAAWAGFDAVELRGAGDLRFRERLPELRAARRAGVVMPTVCVQMDHFVGDFDPELRADAIANLQSQLSVVAEIGGRAAMTPASWGMFSRRLPPFEPPRTPEQDREVLLEGLAALGEHARREGVLLLLEPLNRYEDHMVNTLGQAVALCQELGLPSVGVAGDLFHMNIEEDELGRSIVEAGGWLAHVQLGDSGRLQPGTGHLDFAGAFAALRAIGYDGYLTLECCLRGAPEVALPAAARFLHSLLDQHPAGGGGERATTAAVGPGSAVGQAL